MIDTSFQAAAIAAASPLLGVRADMSPCALWSDLRRIHAERALAEACVNADLARLPEDLDDAALDGHIDRCAEHYEAMTDAEAEMAALIQTMALRGLMDEIGAHLTATCGG